MATRFKSDLHRQKHFLRAWRDYRRLTQDQLAERVGISKPSISRLEHGKQPYTQDLLEKLAEVLNTDPGSLIMRDPTDTEGLWTLWERAEPGQRQQILQIAKVVTGRTVTD